MLAKGGFGREVRDAQLPLAAPPGRFKEPIPVEATRPGRFKEPSPIEGAWPEWQGFPRLLRPQVGESTCWQKGVAARRCGMPSSFRPPRPGGSRSRFPVRRPGPEKVQEAESG